ncbi:MAG: ATP-binding protein [Clostridia bacterium]|nr:ATP-binding protein [Clostridia bacterium]
MDTAKTANAKMVTKLLFRLLPVQILLAAVGAVNGIVSSFFASNFVGTDAMSAVGLYSPLNMLVSSIGAILVGGSVILCGKYMGQNRQDRMHNVFSLNLVLTFLIAAVFTVLFLIMGLFGLTGFFTKDEAVKPLFNSYLIGQSIGILPMMLGSSFSAFLSLENKGKRSLIASIIYIAVNILLNFVFVKQLRMETFGLALASALGMWVFMLIQAQFYVSGKSHLRFSAKDLVWKESREIFHIGLPGALSNIYQTARGLIVNGLLGSFVGSAGISAFAAANNLLGIVWAIPVGMLAVSRMMISVSVGEEDRRTLTDIMRVMFRRFIPLMCAVSAAIILAAVPLTRIFFRDPSEPVYMMTVWGLRILPLCMPLSIIYMHFNCYGEASGKHGLVHLLSALDGVVCVAGFTALLIRPIGMNSVYIANVLNGAVTTLVIVGYAWLRNKRFPKNMEQLMVIPESFGAAENDRMDMSVESNEEVVRIAEQVQKFCLERGVDERRAYLAGLSMEEMAGNIVDHGFTKDDKRHCVDVRVVHKGDDVILRIKDDCVPFDPGERQQLAEGEDITKNIGIRMVFKIASEVKYQNILGMNVLTIRI